MRDVIYQIVAKQFNIDVQILNPESGLHNVEHWDSVSHMGLIFALEDELGVQFHDDDLENTITIAGIEKALVRLQHV